MYVVSCKLRVTLTFCPYIGEKLQNVVIVQCKTIISPFSLSIFPNISPSLCPLQSKCSCLCHTQQSVPQTEVVQQSGGAF